MLGADQRTPPAAVVFDFDGTILDTETPVFEAWRQVALRRGVEPIPLDLWCQGIGLAEDAFDKAGWFRDRLGPDADMDEVHLERREVRDQLLAALDLRPGIEAWITACAEADIPVAIASSSPLEWVGRHLDDRSLRDCFQVVSCAGDGVPGKPDPAVYLSACRDLGVDPAAALAIEDSSHGVTGAKAAGLACIAVPGPMTAQMDFSHADWLAGSLAEFDSAVFPLR